MGSRAIFIICRDEAAARKQFGAFEGEIGVLLHADGPSFLRERRIRSRSACSLFQAAISSAGLWESFGTDWVCLDAEVMPWSAKAQELLKEQYAAVGAAAAAALPAAIGALERAEQRALARTACFDSLPCAGRKGCGVCRGVPALLRGWSSPPTTCVSRPSISWRCSGKTHVDQDHVWHMQTLRQLAEADPKLFFATAFTDVQLVGPGEREACDGVVGGNDESRRRRDCGEAERLHRAR